MTKVDLIHHEYQRAFEFEWKRGELLSSKAEKYIITIGIIFGFGLFKTPTIQELFNHSNLSIITWSIFVGILSLFLSLVFSIASLRTIQFDSYPRGEILFKKLSDRSVNDKNAKIKVAKMYLKARDKNARYNDGRAILLKWSGILLTLGFILIILTHLILILFFQEKISS